MNQEHLTRRHRLAGLSRRLAVSTANDPWGRVDAEGTVYVRTAGGERVVGSWQAGSPDEALAFFRRKFDALDTEVALLEQRMSATDLSPGSARATIDRLLAAVADANAIGDLDSLRARLEALTGQVDHRREEVRAAREHALEEPHRLEEIERRRMGEQFGGNAGWSRGEGRGARDEGRGTRDEGRGTRG